MLQHFLCGGWGRLFIAGALMLAFGVSGPGCSKDDEGDPSGEGQVAADAGGSQSVCSGAASQGKTCDDGDPCTVGDTCNTSGQCISGVPLTCSEDDGNPCTKAMCVASIDDPAAGECKQVPQDNTEISDICFTYRCEDGAAVNTGNATSNPCVSLEPNLNECISGYTCDPTVADASAERCTPIVYAGDCDDGDACTTADTCASGGCTGVVFTCDDGIACTDDGCLSESGCTHVANASLCNDSNPCTDDSCNLDDGCLNTPLNDVDCSDDEPCTTADICKSGTCVGESITTESNVCDGVDNDCDGLTDEDCSLLLRAQALGDGHGSAQNDTFQIRHRLGAPRTGGTAQNDNFSVHSGTAKGSAQ